jgi:hypothetical protein
MPVSRFFSNFLDLISKDTASKTKAKRASKADVEKYNSVPENPYLVSFPRTGSHWLRMLSELYFKRPTLVRPFHFGNNRDYLYLHHHDKDMDLQRKNIIYLYREPVATVYSQLTYNSGDINCADSIRQITEEYALHVEKWLCRETFTTRKTVLNYEQLQTNLVAEFSKLTSHLGLPLDPERLVAVSAQITKDKVKEKTVLHDEKVVNQCSTYTNQRKAFAEKYHSLIWSVMLDSRPHLGAYFKRE